MKRPFSVLLYESIHEDGLALLREKAQVRIAVSWAEEDLVKQVQDVDAIIIRANGAVTRRIIENAPRLKVIGRHGVGVEAIDTGAAQERGICVVNTPGSNTESVAEHCIGMMIALSKHLVQTDKALREGRWQVRYEYIGQELHGKTLGVIGLGRIGQRLAEICRRAFGMTILYHDTVHCRDAERLLTARRVSLEHLLAESDYVSLHVPLLPETRHLIGLRELGLMKPTAYLLNTSRGPVVDEKALIEALEQRTIAGAGIDVFEHEPLPEDHDFLGLENVVVTPHLAAHTDEALRNMALVVVLDVIDVLEGRKPSHLVHMAE